MSFVEGQEDAHIIAIYIEENAKTNIEIFGYGSGGASHMGSWLSLANELGIKAAALFDNDEAGQCAYAEAVTQFKTNPKILLLILPTADIRDKPDKNKEGIFDEAWKLKPAFETAWNTLLDKATAFLK
jgi:predicted ATP-dependent endonuclease of OLD family